MEWWKKFISDKKRVFSHVHILNGKLDKIFTKAYILL